jgi:citrate lyase subunit beta/citryl-CoA lyase
MVILDLEDGVNPGDRPAARRHLVDNPLDPERTIVRINSADSPDHGADRAALRRTPYSLVMLAKSESASQISSLAPFRVIGLCETPRGVLAAMDLAGQANTVGLMWGAEDLVAALGGRTSRHTDGTYREFALFARSQVLLACGAHHRAAIDAVHLDIADVVGLRREAEDGAASGFAATACIHPTQVGVVRDAYRPTEAELAWASGVLDAASSSRGVFTYEGRMVDAPLLSHARHIVDAADAADR